MSYKVKAKVLVEVEAEFEDDPPSEEMLGFYLDEDFASMQKEITVIEFECEKLSD
jgi:hypothetical protein